MLEKMEAQIKTFDPTNTEHWPVEEVTVKVNFKLESWERQDLSKQQKLNEKGRSNIRFWWNSFCWRNGFKSCKSNVDSTKFGLSENKAKSKTDDYSKGQEIICISSDSEHRNAEQKIENTLLWKLRLPKKCSKYIPEEVREKHEIGWLSKCQAPLKSTPSNALESLDENMSSTEPCFFQGGNERTSVGSYGVWYELYSKALIQHI